MDRALPASRGRGRALAVVAAALALAAAVAWLRAPRLQVATSPQLAMVRIDVFRDEVLLRAHVEPLRSMQLDAAETGRVDEVFAHDGERVAAGAPLYRLQSDAQEQLLMQRSSEVAQQMANVSVERSAQAASLAQNRRDLAQLQAQQQQAESDWQRQARLADQGFVSPAAVEQSRRKRDLADRLLAQAKADQRTEAAIRDQSIAEMARAVQGLQRGLQLLERSRDRLLQRAPMAGQLSGFDLKMGASVRPGDQLGRIEIPLAACNWWPTSMSSGCLACNPARRPTATSARSCSSRRFRRCRVARCVCCCVGRTALRRRRCAPARRSTYGCN